MSPHHHNTQPLEVVFGLHEGDHIRFEVPGPASPNAKTDWDRSALNVEIHIHVGSFSGYRSLVMFSDDFHLFRSSLKRLLSAEPVTASLESGDLLSVDVSAGENSYSVWMQLDALEQDGEVVLLDDGEENWEWRLTMDRGALDALASAVTRVSERYPTWSVPRS